MFFEHPPEMSRCTEPRSFLDFRNGQFSVSQQYRSKVNAVCNEIVDQRHARYAFETLVQGSPVCIEGFCEILYRDFFHVICLQVINQRA